MSDDKQRDSIPFAILWFLVPLLVVLVLTYLYG